MPNRELASAVCVALIVCSAQASAAVTAPSELEKIYPQPDVALGEQLQKNEIENAHALIQELQGQIVKRYRPGETLRDAHPKAHGCVTAAFAVEPQLPPELAHGVFQPGRTYPAQLRFSNGFIRVQPDAEGDGRGMAIKLYGVPGSKLFQEPGREDQHDFLLLTSPSFFVSDTGKYLDIFKRYSAIEHKPHWWQKSEALGIPFLMGWDGWRVMQRINDTHIAHPLEARYFSTLPYRLGTGEAVKYSARPCVPGTSKMPENPGPNYLRERLAATLEAGSACMELLIQPRGKAPFSVEDMVTEWPERDAPFIRAATITIPPQKFNTPEQIAGCEAEEFNPWRVLTEHKPLGAISRTRRVVYEALGAFRRERKAYVTLEQGWDEAARNRFYHDPQGSPIVPYPWFLALERASDDTPFANPAHLRSFGLLYWGAPDPQLNPDSLPVGLTRDEDLKGAPWLGMNCAACHVTEMEVAAVKDRALRTVLIDGGSSHFDFWTFIGALKDALRTTRDRPEKFARFAAAVLGDGAATNKVAALRSELDSVLAEHEAWAIRNHTDLLPGPGRVDAMNVILNQVTAHMLNYPDNAKPANAPVSYPFVWDAPYLDCVQYNGAVGNAGAGAIGRNVGQVLGVFGQARVPGGILPGYPNSVRTHYLLDLEQTMQTLRAPRWQELADKGVLPPLDAAEVERGKRAYEKACIRCHKRIDEFPRQLAAVPATLVPADVIGTDPMATKGFFRRMAVTGPLKGRKAGYVGGQPFGAAEPASEVLAHVVTGVIVSDVAHLGSASGLLAKLGFDGLIDRIRRKLSWGKSDERDAVAQERQDAEALPQTAAAADALVASLGKGGLRQDGPDADSTPDCQQAREEPRYRARPLDGIWATGPYLHNGSVPNLAALLKLEERPACFHVGSRVFDPEKVGFVSEGCTNAKSQAGAGPRTMLFDTSLPGNSNKGHDMTNDLKDAEKRALLEYLKSL